jgi:hypothetical protein
MDHIDRPGCAFDPRASKAMPRLIESQTGKSQLLDRYRRHPCSVRWGPVAGTDTDHLDRSMVIGIPQERIDRLECGTRRPTRHFVPTLLESHGDPTTLLHE